MNAHALGIIEFPAVLELVAVRAGTARGAERVRSLRPSRDVPQIERTLSRVAAVRALAAEDSGWTSHPVPDLREALARLRVEGSVWSAAELRSAHTLLQSSRYTAEALRRPGRAAMATAVLAGHAARLVQASAEEVAIDRVVAENGEVRDTASPVLARLRRELRASEGKLVALLERIVAQLESHQQVPDASVTVRAGRYVIPVRREARSAVGGIVHDTSASGATLFVEPPAAIEEGNRIRELEAEHAREVERLLRELTARLRPARDRLLDALDALVELDALHATARFARDFRCGGTTLAEPGSGFSVRGGRHPLLEAQGVDVVPFDLEMAPAERTLLVSGPNTGGKTVLLKTLGLLAALIQTGIPAPAAAGSRLAVFDDIFADVGDEQSIQANLSTFSAHLGNLREILAAATSESLVLVDELGSGTDPLEGAALGTSILEELTSRGTVTLATTHLGALKDLAARVPGVVNASLEFDVVALAPTFRFVKGVPGRSYGLSIARRLDLPESVLTRAAARLPQAERDVDALLADLERRGAALAERERLAAESLEAARETAHRLAERERLVREREREVERRAHREARRYLLEARAQIEQSIRELKRAGAEQLEQTARDVRQRVERGAASHAAAVDRLDCEEQAPGRGGAGGAAPEIGDVVELQTLEGRTGRLVDVRDDAAVVAVGGVKLAVPVATLRRAAVQRPPSEVMVPLRGDAPDPVVPSEIDLRGMRADEADAAVLQAVDAAVRADLRSLRIIHGKGTGALRQRVAEMLRKDTRVQGFRLGAWNEGGAGVTVVTL